MKTLKLYPRAPSLADLFDMVGDEPVLVETKDGRLFVLSAADDFASEVELLRRNHALLAALDQWKKDDRTVSIEQAERLLTGDRSE